METKRKKSPVEHQRPCVLDIWVVSKDTAVKNWKILVGSTALAVVLAIFLIFALRHTSTSRTAQPAPQTESSSSSTCSSDGIVCCGCEEDVDKGNNDADEYAESIKDDLFTVDGHTTSVSSSQSPSSLPDPISSSTESSTSSASKTSTSWSGKGVTSCPWQFVMSDLTHRLRLLEMAFKDQVVAREVMTAEVSNQSLSHDDLARRLDKLTRAVTSLSRSLKVTRDQQKELVLRLFSDECLGFLVLIYIIIRIIMAARLRLGDRQLLYHGNSNGGAPTPSQNGGRGSIPRSVSNNSINRSAVIGQPRKSSTPTTPPSFSTSLPQVPTTTYEKQSLVSLTHDIVAITFHGSQLSSPSDLKDQRSPLSCDIDGFLNDVTSGHIGSAMPNHLRHHIQDAKTLLACPQSKLYIVVLDLCADMSGGAGEINEVKDGRCGDTSLASIKEASDDQERCGWSGVIKTGQSSSLSKDGAALRFKQPGVSGGQMVRPNDLELASLRHVKSMGGHVIVIIAGDEGSENFSGNVLYNKSLPMLQSDLLQECASNDRLISVWREFSLFQVGHTKKIATTVLNMKGK